MSNASGSQTELIDLDQIDDVRDAVHRAVAALVQGGVVGLSTEAGPILVVNALHSHSLALIQEGSGPAIDSASRRILLSSHEAVPDWIPGLAPTHARLLRRAWPGTTVFSFEANWRQGLAGHLPGNLVERMTPAGYLSFGMPRTLFCRQVLSLLPCPLLAVDSGDDDDYAGFGPPVLVFRSKTTDSRTRGTHVRISNQDVAIERPGAISAEELAQMKSTSLLFVCTGNTCRSPMAEALCKILLSEKLVCSSDQLSSRGYLVHSAGIFASHGSPAAGHAVDVVRSRGGSLANHASRRLSLELIEQADHIIPMTAEHLELILDIAPEAEAKCRLLHPLGEDVDDPYGSDRDNYHRKAVEIENYLRPIVERLVAESGSPPKPTEA
jgi:protein-tyrosine phosphatase